MYSFVGQKSVAQHSHAASQLRLWEQRVKLKGSKVRSESVSGGGAEGFEFEHTPWAPSSSSSSPPSEMRGGAREAYALFNGGPLFCCYGNRRVEMHKKRKGEKKKKTEEEEMQDENGWITEQNEDET